MFVWMVCSMFVYAICFVIKISVLPEMALLINEINPGCWYDFASYFTAVSSVQNINTCFSPFSYYFLAIWKPKIIYSIIIYHEINWEFSMFNLNAMCHSKL